MKTKAEILRRLHDIEGTISSLDVSQIVSSHDFAEYKENIGRIKALNWVLNRD